MERLSFDDYKKQIEVIRSMPHVSAMHDEICEFAKVNESPIVTLHRLHDAIRELYPVNYSYDRELLDYKHSIDFHLKTEDKPQIISDLINFEIEELDNQHNYIFNQVKTDIISNPRDTFQSNLTESEIIRIANELIESKFIEVDSVDIFVYAFSKKPIKEAHQINWVKKYNSCTDNICLAILIHHLAPNETSSNFKSVTYKLYKLFNTPAKKPESLRSFDAALRKARNKSYKETEATSQLNSILHS